MTLGSSFRRCLLLSIVLPAMAIATMDANREM